MRSDEQADQKMEDEQAALLDGIAAIEKAQNEIDAALDDVLAKIRKTRESLEALKCEG